MTADISAEAVRKKAEAFLDLKWVKAMYSYTRTVSGINAPEPPLDQPGMITENRPGKPILTVPALMDRARQNAGRWEPLLGDMLKVAQPIKDYARASIITVEQIGKDSKKLAPAVWAKLSAEEQQVLKAQFDEMVSDLKEAAEANSVKALTMRDKILAFKADIVEDYDSSAEVQKKYKGWIEEQEKDIHVWEEAHGLEKGDTKAYIAKLQQDIHDYNVKWQGLAGGAGSSALFLFVLPPFGVIATLIMASVMGTQAKVAKLEMEALAARLDKANKYSAVTVFFSTIDSMFERMKEAIAQAAEALGNVAGLWSAIALDLQTVQDTSMTGVGGLGGDKGWPAPVSLTKRLGVVGSYELLIKDCDVFVQYAFVTDIRKVEPGFGK
ncbi:hypothetical protein [Siccirubricoccus sp. G192]|uniref:hypothetical protein n=1 Tax=Siccirubricoccus sp. G192 TaxID=2849651 RepID=UPI001C2C9DA9|nr:hypothetical protein [Siccirubricoccus sp. G192]MBV1800069.1 hypothetical protein [Siccirubricoccus sp. G192]